MTEAEKALILAFIDNSISQLQALRGAISIVGRPSGGVKVSAPAQDVSPSLSDQDFGSAYDRMMKSIERGGDDILGENGADAQ
jgi:hypothetical protein